MDAPCKDCKERYIGCHSRCEKYLAYREERDKVARERLKEEATWPVWRGNLARFKNESHSEKE